MNRTPDARLVLTMRDAIWSVQRAAKADDQTAGLKGIKACWEAAKGFFADDPESLASFHERMQGIVDDLKAGNYDEAFATAEFVRQQLQQLGLAMAANGQLPELLDELSQLQARMTPFDHYLGRLCEQTYRDRGSPEQILMFGMLHILEHVLAGELENGSTPETLLEGKLAQGGDEALDVRVAAELVERLFSSEQWTNLVQASKSRGIPRLVLLTDMLVRVIEKTAHERPTGIMPRGHYSVVGSFIFAAGLQIAVTQPALGKELVEERKAKKAESGNPL